MSRIWAVWRAGNLQIAHTHNKTQLAKPQLGITTLPLSLFTQHKHNVAVASIQSDTLYNHNVSTHNALVT